MQAATDRHEGASTTSTRQGERRHLFRRMRQRWQLYLLILPALVYFAIFAYVPLYGLQLAFKDFQVFRGMSASPWVGLDHFRDLFSSPKFPQLIRNTLLISLYRLIFGFPVPILFALLLNEMRHVWYKRSVQTITYFPHFLSWVVMAGIVINLLGPTGIINTVLRGWGWDPINFLANPDLFRTNLVVTGILKEFGWGAIIYLAALPGIDPQLYESAKVDGAGKLRQIRDITLPGLRPVMAIVLVLSLGTLLDAGFDQVFMLLNGATLEVGDIIDTYVYRVGLLEANFELATAVGLFKGVVGMILIVSANMVLRRFGERSLW
jgi:putative aldouronate transport system permease protein